MLFEGTCNTLFFNDWLEQMLLPVLWVGSLIVMDNATFHKSQKTIDLIWEVGRTPLFLFAL
jgi:transposase